MSVAQGSGSASVLTDRERQLLAGGLSLGIVKLADFGISRFLDSGKGGSLTFVGTELYM